ncbi:MAG: hypothetical protein NZ942_02765 [Candidatus Aenigmarchaeota archaeon]|nr:hypothetical protein [Candidatus Aenigmarchaeota archaeon]
MLIFSIFEKIFKKKETEKMEKEENLEKPSLEKESVKPDLKPGPLTENFFDITPIREKKKK